MTGLVVIGEDALCCALGRRIALTITGQPLALDPIQTGGVTGLRRNLARYCQLSDRFRVLCIADTDGGCAKDMRGEWLPKRSLPNFALRFAVQEAESWIMADREALADFLDVRVSRVPLNPDDVYDPKSSLLELARRARDRELRADLVSQFNPTKAGSGYNERLVAFVSTQWRPHVASGQSESLARAVRQVTNWAAAG